jgi:formiminoglutamate deiminase
VTRLYVSRALLAEGWRSDVLIAIEGRMISAITPDVPSPADALHVAGVAVPGLPNNAFQRAMAGLTERRGPEDDSFWTWREVMYRFLARMTPDDIQDVAALAYLEMLEAGFTTVGEFHYVHKAPDGSQYADPAETAGRIVSAAAQCGIGLTLLPCFYAHGGCGGKAAQPGQVRFLSDLDGFAAIVEGGRRHLQSLEGARLGIAPHSVRAVDAGELEHLVRTFPSGPVHIHPAEQVLEVEECVAWSGARPVEWLLDHIQVDRRWCLIHCTHMTPEETQRLAKSGAVAGLCPVTEGNLGDGTFLGVEYEAAGGHIAVGTDSNVRIAANEELRALEYSQRLRHQRRNRLGLAGRSTGRGLFEMARVGGAQALGLDSVSTGGLASGQAADIVVLDDTHPALVGRTDDAVLDAWIFAAGHVVRDVFAGGRHVVVDGRHFRTSDIRHRYAKAVNRLVHDG